MEVDSGNRELDQLIQHWLQWDDKQSKSYAAIVDLVQQNHWEKLNNIMTKRLKFGTAGIRGRMGPG